MHLFSGGAEGLLRDALWLHHPRWLWRAGEGRDRRAAPVLIGSERSRGQRWSRCPRRASGRQHSPRANDPGPNGRRRGEVVRFDPEHSLASGRSGTTPSARARRRRTWCRRSASPSDTPPDAPAW